MFAIVDVGQAKIRNLKQFEIRKGRKMVVFLVCVELSLVIESATVTPSKTQFKKEVFEEVI